MRIRILKVIAVSLLINIVTCQQSLEDNSNQNADNGIPVSQVVDMILNKGRRSLNPTRAARAESLREALRTDHKHKHKKSLRNVDIAEVEVDPSDMMDTQANLIESELKNALSHKKSALFDKPFVEKHGRDDFLVIQPGFKDPFVTVVPNAIYYNIEKRCVNWLDDCNSQGIRARLLRGVQSPYKK